MMNVEWGERNGAYPAIYILLYLKKIKMQRTYFGENWEKCAQLYIQVLMNNWKIYC